jgi:hypothetical protein
MQARKEPPARYCWRTTPQTKGAIRPESDPLRGAVTCRDSKLCDCSRRGDPPDVTGPHGEPKVAVRTAGDRLGIAAGPWDRKLIEGSGRCNPPDGIDLIGKPEVAVRTAGYSPRGAKAP